MNAFEKLSSLKVTHEALESELSALRKRPHMTPKEEMRARAIKKQKLVTKDRIRVLAAAARRTG
jgi:hypothetical protein